MKGKKEETVDWADPGELDWDRRLWEQQSSQELGGVSRFGGKETVGLTH